MEDVVDEQHRLVPRRSFRMQWLQHDVPIDRQLLNAIHIPPIRRLMLGADRVRYPRRRKGSSQMSHVNWRPVPRAILKYRDVDLGATEEVGELEEVASESREDGLVVVEVDTDEDRAYVPQVAVPTFVSDYSSRALAARILLAPLLPPQHQRSSQRARKRRETHWTKGKAVVKLLLDFSERGVGGEVEGRYAVLDGKGRGVERSVLRPRVWLAAHDEHGHAEDDDEGDESAEDE